MEENTKFFENGEFLRGKGRNDHSQFGEDGYIAAALDRIGRKNFWCFEVGAADGDYLSNTKTLRNDGWFAVLIEKDATHFEKLRLLAGPRIKCFKGDITIQVLDLWLSMAMAPIDIDLGVIDIDGQDLYVWDNLTVHRPRLLLVEFSPYGSPDAMPEDSPHKQAGINPILAMGKTKGYLPLVQTFCNVLFVREDQWNA